MQARELPPAEWSRLLAIEPYRSHGLPTADGNWIMIVVEDAGEIIAASAVHSQVHWDPWWIAPAHQGNAGVTRALIREGVAALADRAIEHAFCTIDEADAYASHAAVNLGFNPAPGRLYLIDVGAVQRRFD